MQKCREAPLQIEGVWQMQNPKAMQLRPRATMEFDGQEENLCN